MIKLTIACQCLMLQYVNNVDVADSNGGEIAIRQIELKCRQHRQY